MPSPLHQATGMSRPAEVHVPPLSRYERWSIGLALIFVSIVIEVAERLPRLDRFKPHYQPSRFPSITAACEGDRRYATVKAEVVDLRRAAPRRPGGSSGRRLRLVGPRD